jgi:hypothetical protein
MHNCRLLNNHIRFILTNGKSAKTCVQAALVVLFSFLLIEPAQAVDVETLPLGVRMTEVRFGVISGLDETWGSDGRLYNLGETRSVTFDAATLARVSPQAQALIQALNQFGSQNLGQTLQLGTLNISTLPQIQYFAPVFAYGVSDRLTIGFGVPVVRYSNEISLSASASNLDFYRKQLGGASSALDAVLNMNLVSETQKVLVEKGYRALTSRNDTFLGDMQVSMLYRLPDAGSWALLHQLTLTLPTGPKDDPNDLVALNSFARTSIEAALIAGKSVAPRWTVLPYTSFLLPIPDRVSKRVPTSASDTLPDASTVQDVSRWIGPTVAIGSDFRWEVMDRWSIKTGVEGAIKAPDQYTGMGRVDLLAANTDSSVIRAKGGISYSTVEDYKLKKSAVPSRMALEVTDTVVGRNIERQLRTDLTAVLFF